jgi:RNA-binding protein YlmH
MSELKSNKIEDFLDVTKCDLAHHAAQLQTDFTDPNQIEIAGTISQQSGTLISLIQAGELTQAEEERKTLLATCRKLKDLL